MISEPTAPSLIDCATCGAVIPTPEEWMGMCPACWGRAGLLAAEAMGRETAALQIEGFRMVRRIARGGMGTVYEAYRLVDSQRVALKILREDLMGNPRFQELFRRECETLAQLDHMHIVRHLGRGEVEGIPYLLMEFIDGPNLQQVLRKGPLAVARALEIMEQICAALEAAHARGVVHRDIKPANVLLDEHGLVKVTDFGLARLPRPEGEAALTGSLVALGGYYAAPELERGDAVVDHRADIYSLGVLFYHLLTGEPPRAHGAAVHQKRNSSLGMTHGLQRIITRAMQTKPEKRFSSVKELRQEVSRVKGFMTRWPLLSQPKSQFMVRLSAWVVAFVVVILGMDHWQQSPEDPAFTLTQAQAIRAAESAVNERWAFAPPNWVPQRRENSLGMRFVSVPGIPVQVSLWETRVRDYQSFQESMNDTSWVRESGFAMPLNKPFLSLIQGEFKSANHSWKNPGFQQTPEHPACGISLFEAQAFCTWLTWKERQNKLIRNDQAYRLPTDAEWSAAAGLKPETGDTPEQRLTHWSTRMHAFPWGHAWPAPDDHFNVAGSEVLGPDWHPGWIFKPRQDPWSRTAPVQSTPASAFGLHHLTGNVSEWTESLFSDDSKVRLYTIRGGSWMDSSREGLSLAHRDRDSPGVRISKRGFRIVFVPHAAEGWHYGQK